MKNQKYEEALKEHWDPEWNIGVRYLRIQSMMTGMSLMTEHPRDLPFPPSGMGESEHVMSRSPELIQKEKNRTRTRNFLESFSSGKVGILISTFRRYNSMNKFLQKSNEDQEIFFKKSKKDLIEDILHDIIMDQAYGNLLQRLGFLPSEFEVDVDINLDGNEVLGKINVKTGPYSFAVDLRNYIVDSEEDSNLQGIHLANLIDKIEEELDGIIVQWRNGDFVDPVISKLAEKFMERKSKHEESIKEKDSVTHEK